MSVLRCPSCGRAWDGVLCFACGHEGGRAAAHAPPPAPSPFGAPPAFGTIPSPSAGTSGPPGGPHGPAGGPLSPLPRPPPPLIAQGPSPPNPGFSSSLPPLPGLGGPPPATSSSSTLPAPAPFAPAPPPPAPFSVNPNRAPPRAPASASPPASAPLPRAQPQSASTMTRAEESAPRPRPATTWKLRAQRVAQSAAVFPLVFVLGFFVAFGVGSVVFLGGPDLADLVRQGKTGPVIRVLEQRERNGDLDAEDALVLGHAYAKRKDHARMITAYKRARAGDAGDDEMLENLLQALVLEGVRPGAIEVLRDWSDDDHVSARLKAKLTDDAFDVRHAALDALSTHVTTPEHRDLTVRVGVKDIEVGVGCAERKAGVDAIRGYVRDPAVRQVFVETNAFNVVLNNLKGSAGVDCIPAAVIDDVYNGLGGGA